MPTQILLAIDTTEVAAASAQAAATRGVVGGIKLGLEFFTANGPQGVRTVAVDGVPLFLDLKLHDIPNTVAKAIQALRPLAPSILTVHAAGGRAMMEDAKAAAPTGTRVVAVTVLTSLDDDALAAVGLAGPAEQAVVRLARLAVDAGAGGIVCSPREVAAVRAAVGPEPLLVVPGVRPAGSARGDQARVATPAEAVRAGADVLVLGRPLRDAPDPAAAARAVAASL